MLRMAASCSDVSTPSATTEACQRVGELLERPQDRQLRIVQDPALDERQVDLDDVELDLAQQPEAGVPRADVVGGEPHADPPARFGVAAQTLEVVDLFALGQLHDQLGRLDAATLGRWSSARSGGTARTRASGATGSR